MTNPTILVADGEPKNLQILKENLEASGFVVITAHNGNKAWEEIQVAPPHLVLTETNLPGLNGYQVLERLQADPNTKSIPLIFLTNQRDVQQRVRGFELGAKDYLVKPLHVKEVIAHIRMVLRRLERRKTEQLETYMKFSGRLDQLNLADLIESFGVERKTGILTMSNGRRTGQIYFRDGAVVNASLGDIKQEPAIYQMLPWNRGYFNMVFKDIDVPDEISISNLGLLLYGIKRLEVREKLIGQLSSPKTSFIITPTFKRLIDRKRVNGEITNFVKLFDGKREVEQIIEESELDDLVALKRIIKLYQQGFIKPTIPPEKKPVLHKRIEHDEEKIEFISRPAPSQKAPSTVASIQTKVPDDIDLDVMPKEKQKDLEQKIRPIFERIEKEKQKVLVPKEEKPEEVLPTFEVERPEPSEKVLDTEAELISAIDLEEDQGRDSFGDDIFIDEELIKRSIITDRPDQQKITRIEAEEEPHFPTKYETEDEAKFRTIKATPEKEEEKAKAKEAVVLPVKEKSKIFEQSKFEKKAPLKPEPPSVKNNIIVVSVDDDCKDELMDILTHDNFSSRTIKELDDLQLDVGKIKFDGFMQYNIVAASLDKPFHIFFESIKPTISGFIFAVDCSRRETWEYTSYLIHSITQKYQLPFVVAVINFHDQSLLTMDVLRYQLNLAESSPLIAWDAVEKSSIRKILSLITRLNPENMPRKVSDLKDSRVENVMP